MIANILEFSLFPKKVKIGYYWYNMVQYVSKITQNMIMAKIVKNNLVKLSDFQIDIDNVDKYIHSQKYWLIFSRANLFGYSFVIFLSFRTYSDIHLSNIHSNEYIQIFIHPKKDICPTLYYTILQSSN